jgi:hypothetical protein
MTNRYIPNKAQSPIKAIRELCIECMGGRHTGHDYKKLIKECPSILCPTYEFRFGINPYNKKTLSINQKKLRTDNLNKSSVPQESWQNRG